jgi:RND family efflux transporter MFP subunit
MRRSRAPVASILLVALAVAASACGRKPAPARPPPVVTAQPLQRRITDWDEYVGSFTAVSSVDVRPRVSGYVEALGFTDGQVVSKGQVLFRIDPRTYQAALDQARAQAARATATLQDAKVELVRSRALLAARATSQQDVDTRTATEKQAEADLGAAQAAVRTAELNLGFTNVTAPISGRISDARATVGNLVNQDTTVLTSIVTLDPIRFTFNGPESQFLKYQRQTGAKVKPGGLLAQIRLQDEPAYRWSGRIAFVDNALDTSSGTVRAYAVVPNPSGFLRPGLFGHMRLAAAADYVALLVPDQAVVTDMSRQLVYVVGVDGKVAVRVIQLGPMVDGLRVVRQGLSGGERVVISGVQHVKPGEAVDARAGQISPEAAEPAAQPDSAPPAAAATFAAQ